MRKIKSFKDYLLLLEKLKVSEVRDLVKKWKNAGGDKRYDELFKGKHRILIPFQPITSPIQVQVTKFLKERGYDNIDYVEGTCKDPKNPNQQPKISKILARFNPELKSKFDNDREKAKRAQGDLAIVVSRHAYDIASMTTDRKWHNDSCMEFRAGSNRHYVTHDVMEGSLVTFLINKSDKNIEKPLARLLIKPFVNTDNNKDVILWTEDRIYGDSVNGYKESVEKWLKSFQPNIVGNFKLHPNLYVDSNSTRNFHKWFNDYDDVFKSSYDSKTYFVYKDGKCGIVDNHNDTVVPMIYDNITETIYGNNVMLCVKDGKYGMMNNKGKVSLECNYDSIEVPNNSYDYTFILKKDRKYGFARIEQWGYSKVDFKVEPIYEYLEYIPGDEQFSFRENGKYGLIDNYNKILLPPTYDKITKNYAFKLGDKIGMLNRNTYKPALLIDCSMADEIKYEWNKDFAIQKNGKLGLVSAEGKILIPCEYTSFSTYRDNHDMVMVCKDNKHGIYSCKEMKEIVPCEYLQITNTGHAYNTYFVKNSSDKWGIIYDHKLVIPCEYETIRMYNFPIVQAYTNNNEIKTINVQNGKIGNFKIETIINKYAIVFTEKNKYGVCDENFNIITPAKWYYIDQAATFDNKICFKVYKDNNTYGIMNIDNEMIVPCEYSQISRISNDIFVLKNSISKKCKLVRLPSHEIILDYKFEYINGINNSKVCVVGENGKYALYNIENGSISNKYDEIAEALNGEVSYYRGYIYGDGKQRLITFKDGKFIESKNAYQYIHNVSCNGYRSIFILCFTGDKMPLKDLYDSKGNLVFENCHDIYINTYDDFITVGQNEGDELIEYKVNSDGTVKK